MIQQGAEAIIILKNNSIIKRRTKKSYRLSIIDEKIRRQRTRSEGKILIRASKIIDVPEVKNMDESSKEITMAFIKGKKLSDNLDSFQIKDQEKICIQIGGNIAKLHDADIIHGDLTTSNMIYVEDKINKKIVNSKTTRVSSNNAKSSVIKNGLSEKMDTNFKIFFIDFGLGFISPKVEDKAVDLHVLRQALEAKHFTHWQKLFQKILEGYSFSKESKKVLEQFKKVETRGRYKEAY